MQMPVVTLTNGVRVGNFCSGYAFTFTDGSVLPACRRDRVEASKLIPVEDTFPRAGGAWLDIGLSWKLTSPLIQMLEDALQVWAKGAADILLVPYPLLDAMKKHPVDPEVDGWLLDFQQRPRAYPFRVIRRDGREGDGQGEGRVRTDRFCY